MEEKEFFNRVKNPNYDFTSTKFINLRTPIEVICEKHGLFKILPYNLLYKQEGCKWCGIEKMAKSKSMSKQEFEIRAKKIHNDKYNYSLSNYTNNKTKIKIICKKCGNIFEQTPNNHLNGFGCKCQRKSKLISEENKE